MYDDDIKNKKATEKDTQNNNFGVGADSDSNMYSGNTNAGNKNSDKLEKNDVLTSETVPGAHNTVQPSDNEDIKKASSFSDDDLDEF
jgi:hypothetical protein